MGCTHNADGTHNSTSTHTVINNHGTNAHRGSTTFDLMSNTDVKSKKQARKNYIHELALSLDSFSLSASLMCVRSAPPVRATASCSLPLKLFGAAFDDVGAFDVRADIDVTSVSLSLACVPLMLLAFVPPLCVRGVVVMVFASVVGASDVIRVPFPLVLLACEPLMSLALIAGVPTSVFAWCRFCCCMK